MTTLAVLAAATALVAAVRSTWSPCGLSMLSTITPLRENARSGKYASTVRWFVAGAVAGGLCLGAALAGLAAAVAAIGPGADTALLVAAGAAALGLAHDLRIGGFRLPAHTRQVNDRWLDDFRRWVYGAGFGWQIGTGLTTFIVTAAVYLMVVLAALTGSPRLALAVGVGFGLVRGLAILAGRGATTQAALLRLHRTIERWSPASRLAAAAVQGAVLVVALAAAEPRLAIVATPLLVAAALGVVGRQPELDPLARS